MARGKKAFIASVVYSLSPGPPKPEGPQHANEVGTVSLCVPNEAPMSGQRALFDPLPLNYTTSCSI